ncbi:MAG: hypothetical protein QSU88_09535, partial [Candidatus Methanoperedens sp.]|nr:hypothetical protein [Candidatus Methanoperedens sp.]
VKDLMKPATDAGKAEPDCEIISIEEKIRRQKRDLKTIPDLDNKIHEIKNNTLEGIKVKDDIPKTAPAIKECHATENVNATVAMMEDVSGLKLEDKLTEIEEEKKRRRKTVAKESDSAIKKSIVSPAKPLIGEKAIKKIEPKKKALNEEKVIQKEAPGGDGKPGKKRARKKKAVK